jgi:hypothetical protein
MLLIGGSAAALPAGEPRPQRGANAGLFTQSISGWQLVRRGEWAVDQPSSTESISLTYRNQGRDVDVVIVEPLAPNTKLPESRLAPHAANVWRQKQVQHEATCSVSHCTKFSHSTWERDKGQRLRHVYYAYSIGGFTTESKLAFRVAQGWQRVTRGRDNSRLIGFISDDAVLDVDELGAAFDRLRSAVD